MKVIVFGATGRTGRAAVERALEAGHEVTAFVRDARRLSSRPESLSAVEGDVLDAVAVAAAIAGQDAILIALGTGSNLRPTTVLSGGTAIIVTAMETQGIRRVICLLSGWLFYTAHPPMFRVITAEHERQLAALRASHLDWVAVCPPQITDGPATGRYRVQGLHRPDGDGQQYHRRPCRHRQSGAWLYHRCETKGRLSPHNGIRREGISQWLEARATSNRQSVSLPA